MSRYQKGKIYKIVSENTDKVYYGSTCNILSKRLSQHRKNYKCYLNGKYNFVSSFNVIEHGNAKIYLVEEFPCNNKMELEKRERYHIEHNECVNMIIPSRSRKEWVKDNKTHLKEYHKKWRDGNTEYKEKRNVYNRERRKDPKVKQREYELAKANKKANELIECGCGNTYKHNKRARHLKTKIHMKFVKTGIKHIKLTKEQWNEKIECEICKGTYRRRCKKDHLKTKLHLNSLTRENANSQIRQTTS